MTTFLATLRCVGCKKVETRPWPGNDVPMCAACFSPMTVEKVETKP